MWVPSLPFCILTPFSVLFLTGLTQVVGALLTHLGLQHSALSCVAHSNKVPLTGTSCLSTLISSLPPSYSNFSILDTFLCRYPSQNPWERSGPPPSYVNIPVTPHVGPLVCYPISQLTLTSQVRSRFDMDASSLHLDSRTLARQPKSPWKSFPPPALGLTLHAM